MACVKLLLEHGATPAGSNALKHVLDREHREGLHLLLAAGADPNEVDLRGETALRWAVWRGRSAQAVASLLDSGAAMDVRRNDGRTAYAMAVCSGQTEVAALLEARGASTDLFAIDRFLGECATADAEQLNGLLADAPRIAVPPEKGYPDLVKLLLDHGASMTIEDTQFHGTPPGWFAHGLHNCGKYDGDYPQVERLLHEKGFL
jgi:Ankyrin repeats (3 copies)